MHSVTQGNAANKPLHRARTSVPQTLEQQQHQIALETSEKASIAFRHEFDERSMSRAMRTEIGRMVERAKAAQLNDLNDKRERYDLSNILFLPKIYIFVVLFISFIFVVKDFFFFLCFPKPK